MMSLLTSKIKTALDLIHTRTGRQTIWLYASEIVLLAGGFIASLIVTRILGPNNYGIFSYTIGLVTFVALFFEFGIHTSCARILATTTDTQAQKRLVGLSALLTVILGVCLALFILFLALIHFGVPDAFQTAIIFAAPFCIIIPFSFYFENICQGTNKISTLSIYNALINLIFLFLVLVFYFLNCLNIQLALTAYFFAIIISTAVALFRLRPNFVGISQDLPTLLKMNRAYGLKVYFGRVATVATYNLDKILLGIFTNPAAVGFYSLSYSIAQPISLLSRSMAYSKYRDFATLEKIPSQILRINQIIVAIIATSITVSGYFLLELFFTSAYQPAKLLLIPLGIAVACQGLYEPYNKFLAARGEGNIIQKITLSTAFVNLLVNIVLIYYYGSIGAAFASLFSMLYTYFLYRIEYQRLTC